ncbi:trypsin-like peptidase domain-containing protein [Moorena sp. SIO4A5]|uniref:nSTAND1 domain-containing NTPase n=1 Tax=Moorena sp. SIO4A5 TaxID=2607838 RepID=UPI0013C84829|nr:trypsin-like peptidase domain-containing protein [Moorena sp. SIO4A5]NEO24022.1 hypothetical protein [Moorena sp. SIO4A5]
MTVQLRAAIARIRKANGRVVGAGFLVSDQHILTCAHVVNAALSRQPSVPDQPNQEIDLDFPLVASGNILRGRVVRWIPVQRSSDILPKTGADIALVELESTLPEGTQPVRLVKAENLWKHPFRVFGFPEGQAVGVSTYGIISNPQANGRVQIDVHGTYPIESGFSGSPVWDEQLDGVAGMTVAIDPKRPQVRAAFIIPTTQLINACPELEEQAIPPCPYRGLFPFREQDAKFFFGREQFTQKLVKAVHKQSLVAVIGASGSGKSSVVFAGLIPQLRSEEGWLIEGFRPGDRPLRNLTKTLVDLRKIETIDPLDQIDQMVEKFQEGKRKLRDVIEDILERNNRTRLLLIADQFEELYTLCKDKSERQIFLDLFLEAVNQIENFTLVITLRADFCGYALSYRPFADALQDADRKLGPMNREELQKVIEQPAQLLGVRIESGLTERILEAVEDEPGYLPLLEFALTLLWAKQQNGQLTHQAYEDIGGVEKALAEYAEQEYQNLSEEDKQRAQRVFIQLVRPGAGTEDTRRLATSTEVGQNNWDLVTRLASARLVVTNKTEKTDEKEETDQETVEIIHEALIREWGTLRGWMEVNREFRTWQERLKVRIQEWGKSNRDDGALLRGVPLGEAEEWLQKRLAELSKDQLDFIKASLELRDREQKERYRLAKEKEEQIKKLERALTESNVREQTLKSQNLLPSHPVESLLEAMKATKLSCEKLNGEVLSLAFDSLLWALSFVRECNRLYGHTVEVSAIAVNSQVQRIVSSSLDGMLCLWDLQGNPIGQPFQEHKVAIRSVVFHPNGKVIVSGNDDGKLELWDLEGTLIKSFQGHNNWVTALAFSPDGKFIVSGCFDKTLRLWNLQGKPIGAPFLGHEAPITSVTFTTNGKYIVSGSRDTTVRLWNLQGKSIKLPFTEDDYEVNSVAFNPQKTLIACGNEGGRIVLWDLEELKITSSFSAHDQSICSIAFSPDGKWIISGSEESTIGLWDLQGNRLALLRGHQGKVTTVAFNSESNLIFSGSADTTVRLWSLQNPLYGNQFQIKGNHQNMVNSVTFNPYSKRIISANSDCTLKIWDLQGNLIESLAVGDSTEVISIAFSPDGQWMITGCADGRLILRTSQGKLIEKSFQGHKDDVTSVAFSPDSKLIVSGGADKRICLWDLQGNLIKPPFRGHKEMISSVAFSPNGEQIISGGYDGGLYLWDVNGDQTFRPLQQEGSGILSVAFSLNGQWIVTGSMNQSLQLWNYKSKEMSLLQGHKGWVRTVDFSPDSKFIVSGSADYTLRLWDVKGNAIGPPLEGHKDRISSVSFSPDGQWIISGSHDGTLRLWEGNVKAYMDRARQRLSGHSLLLDQYGLTS